MPMVHSPRLWCTHHGCDSRLAFGTSDPAPSSCVSLMPPKYPKYEILHSASYWQDLRRRREMWSARVRRQETQPPEAGNVYVLSAPKQAGHSSAAAGSRPVIRTTNTISATRAGEDERLLERFAAKKKKDAEEERLAEVARKKRVAARNAKKKWVCLLHRGE
ncbi:hypothetical protein DFH06DRAFT_1151379 [Mycena polygramma]|nr:hypothetical protein DFH06DRAFT_1151379 [Mycena polygramma]